MPLAELGWDLCNWARYIISSTWLTPWSAHPEDHSALSFYMRLNGAKLGRGVYVNSLGVLDHNCWSSATMSSSAGAFACRATRSNAAW